ncbi:MAG: hypothetical protein V9F04_16640 [Dermatophilaceae bacterium]
MHIIRLSLVSFILLSVLGGGTMIRPNVAQAAQSNEIGSGGNGTELVVSEGAQRADVGISIESQVLSPQNSTYQILPFSQDWSTVSQITANDDWSGVPGIVGYLGDHTPATTAPVDPQAVLVFSSTVDVIANQSNPNTNTGGGVGEFDGISNPTIALQGSGTADAPFILIFLNTTGFGKCFCKF